MATKTLIATVTKTSAKEIQKLIDDYKDNYEIPGYGYDSLEIVSEGGVKKLKVVIKT